MKYTREVTNAVGLTAEAAEALDLLVRLAARRGMALSKQQVVSALVVDCAADVVKVGLHRLAEEAR